MVTTEVWRAAGMPAMIPSGYNETDGDFLCIGCLESRLVRLTPADFIDVPINDAGDPWHTERLRSRLAGA
jgi:tellurite resistance-related uncharacterized protein